MKNEGRMSRRGVTQALRTPKLLLLLWVFQTFSIPAYADIADGEESVCFFSKWYCVTFVPAEPVKQRQATWEHPPLHIKLFQVKLLAWNEPKGEELAKTLMSGDELTVALEDSWYDRLKSGGRKAALLKEACNDVLPIPKGTPQYRLLDVLVHKAPGLPGGKADCTGFASR